MRTVNRQPMSVKQLDYSDIKYKFFNHSNWKGVCDDKNYLGVDQETFEDSNNVYVDSEGILKSRPSLKQYIMTQDGLQTIYDLWTFGEWTVYKTNATTLYFVKGDSISEPVIVPAEFKLVQADEKVFVFSKNSLSYFDLVTETWVSDAIDKIYVPVTETVTLGKHVENESLNVLTTSCITRYLYEKDEALVDVAGKYCKVTIDGDSYNVTFTNLTPLVFVRKAKSLTSANYFNGVPLVFSNVSNGISILGEWNDETGYSLYYTYNDVLYYALPGLDGQLSKNSAPLPAISQSKDHTYAVLYKDDGPYAYTIEYSKETVVPFTEWTSLITPFLYTEDDKQYIKGIGIKASPHLEDTAYKLAGSSLGYYVDEKVYCIKMLLSLTSDSNVKSYYFCDCVSTKNGKYLTHLYNVLGTPNNNWVITTFCNENYYISFVHNWYVSGGTSLPVHNPTRQYVYKIDNTNNTLTALTGIPPLCVGKNSAGSNLSVKNLYSNQIQISYYNNTFYMYMLVPTVVKTSIDTGTSEDEEISLHTVTFTHSETMYNSDETSYTDVSSESYRELDLVLPVSYYDATTSPVLDSVEYIISAYVTNILTSKYYIYGNDIIPLLKQGIAAGLSSSNFYTIADDTLYTSNLINPVQIDVETSGELNFDVFDYEAELGQYFVSKGKTLYINAQGANQDVDDFQWYFPKRNVQEFDYEITNLHPISTTDLAIFLKDSIYYATPTNVTIGGVETTAYSYYKSRIPLGCEKGSDVITSYDNKYTMFTTKRGFVAMSYQDFISSEEQALTFLSDTIYDVFSKWNVGAVKLFQYNFWIILYRLDSNKAFVFDMRGNSWWPVEYITNVKKIIELDRKPYVLAGFYLFYFDKTNDNYFDGTSLEIGRINWHLSSQKLHLSAINYYKHIVNLTFFGYNYGDKDVNVKFNLRVVNYRKQTDTNETKSFSSVDYKIQLTRTFVTRINYYKVNQVQYILESCRDEDVEDSKPVPLSLTAISLKYLVTGQVR